MKPLQLVPVVIALAGCSAAASPRLDATPPGGDPSATASVIAPPSAVPTPSASTSSVPSATVVAGEAWIAFESAGRIHLARPDGSGEHVLNAAPAGGPESKADWSHDGQRLAFRVEDDDGTTDLWTANADGSAVELLFDCAAPCAWADEPSWSPDDRSIVFQQGTAAGATGLGLGSIRTIDVATKLVAVTFTGAPTEYCFVPRWSPDGASVVVEVDRFDSSRLDASHVVEATIGIVHLSDRTPAFARLQPWDSMAAQPDWSPTGDMILFVRPEAGKLSDLQVIKIDGSAVRPLTNLAATGGRALQASWTPAGEQAIFVAESEPRIGWIALIRADGTDQQAIPLPAGLRTHPRLRPTR